MGDIVEFDVYGVEAVGEFLCLRIDAGDGLQLLCGHADLHHGAPVVAGEKVVGSIDGCLDFASMVERLPFLLQLLLLSLHQLGCGELVVLKLEEIAVLLARLDLLLKTPQALLGLAIARESLGEGCPILAVVGDDIDDVQLEVVLLEKQVLMLRVDIDELFAQLAHQLLRNGHVVDEGARLARAGQFATDDGVVGVEVEVVLLEERRKVVAAEVEMSLYRTLHRPSVVALRPLDQFTVGPVAQQEANGPEDNGLARSRLARDDGEARVEVDVQLVNQREILDI